MGAVPDAVTSRVACIRRSGPGGLGAGGEVPGALRLAARPRLQRYSGAVRGGYVRHGLRLLCEHSGALQCQRRSRLHVGQDVLQLWRWMRPDRRRFMSAGHSWQAALHSLLAKQGAGDLAAGRDGDGGDPFCSGAGVRRVCVAGEH